MRCVVPVVTNCYQYHLHKVFGFGDMEVSFDYLDGAD